MFPTRLMAARLLSTNMLVGPATKGSLSSSSSTPRILSRRTMTTRSWTSQSRSRRLLSTQQQQQLQPTKRPVFLVFTVMFVAWGASEWTFGNQELSKNEQLRQEFLSTLPDNKNNRNDDADDDVILFHCVVRRTTGFTQCLSGVQLRDAVKVLQEGVGPEGLYNMRRLPAKQSMGTDTLGWFPT